MLGGLVAGTLDILYAMLFWSMKANVPSTRILQSVASGVLGKASFEGGTRTAALGLGLHFFIALSMSVAYYLFAGRLPILHRRPLICGAVYGLGLYIVMNFIVVPLSAAMPGSKDPVWVLLSVLVHMLLIGVPIALSTRVAVARSQAVR
jgi:hypothetical protein